MSMKESPESGTAKNSEETHSRTKLDERGQGLLLELNQTDSESLFNNIVLTYFIPLETWYTRTIVDKVSRPSQ